MEREDGEMKKFLSVVLAVFAVFFAGCGKKTEYALTEDTFFLVMTNMQYYPEQYIDCDIEYDCFTYRLTDVDGKEYTCGVRKCSSGYGCTCGRDTIIGFILEYDQALPEPKNQSEDSNDKTWVHLKGRLKNAEKKDIIIHSYLPNGEIDENNTENIVFLVFSVESCDLIEDYSNLRYYVTK